MNDPSIRGDRNIMVRDTNTDIIEKLLKYFYEKMLPKTCRNTI